jgi:dynein heavy chain
VTISMINSTFKENLNSSTGAFDLLDKFKSIETRPKIKECLQDKYQDVLLRYANELEEMQEIYQQNHTNPLRPKNMPENSGKIAWARSIVTRIKTPIDKFKT